MPEKQRPIAHLQERPIIAYGYIATWERPKDGDYGILLNQVDLFDFDSAKNQLAPTLDHCWLWVPDAFWENIHPHPSAAGISNRIHDRVRFVGEVRGYTRSDGSRDFGLSLRNELPITAAAQKQLRIGNAKMGKKIERLSLAEIADRWIQQDLYRKQILRALGDWGDCGISKKDAIGNCAANQAALEQYARTRFGCFLPDQRGVREPGWPQGDPVRLCEYADLVISDQCRKLRIDC